MTGIPSRNLDRATLTIRARGDVLAVGKECMAQRICDATARFQISS